MPDERDKDEPDKDEPDTDEHAHPAINVSAALGEAGHEVEELGYDGIADTGGVTKHDEQSELDAQHEIDRDIAVE
jgi:hypothetical protein